MINEGKWLEWMDEISASDFVVIDQFLDLTLLSEVQHFFQNILDTNSLKKAAVGSLDKRVIFAEIRGDYTYWLDRDKDKQLDQFFLLTDDMIKVFNRYCFLSLSGSEFHLAKYPPGAFYKKHVDQFKNSNNRMISFILYLNEEWKQGDGGELVIYRPDRDVTINPILNTAVLFKSEGVLHEVLPTNVHRKSLTGWLLYQSPII
jgi:SM-20-related protein